MICGSDQDITVLFRIQPKQEEQLTIFELVKLALNELYVEGTKEHGSKLDAEITKQVSYLADSYRKLGSDDRNPIDYEDPATRFAYVYKYTASPGDYVVQTLQAARKAPGATSSGSSSISPTTPASPRRRSPATSSTANRHGQTLGPKSGTRLKPQYR